MAWSCTECRVGGVAHESVRLKVVSWQGGCMARFVPLSVRRGRRAPFEFVDGIPDHIRAKLEEWVEGFFDFGHYAGGLAVDNIDAAITALQLPVVERAPADRFSELMDLASSDDERFLDLLDFVCVASSQQRRDALDRILDGGMSIYRVSAGAPFALEERVTEEARAALAGAVDHTDLAAEHLTQAWASAYGRDRDATAAWNSAVKAIEHLLHPIVEPKNAKATLGSMVSALRNRPEGWSFEIAARHGDRTARPFLQALELIGYEPGRHGTDPSRATIEQARVVVLQAVTIVEWLRAGALVRVDR